MRGREASNYDGVVAEYASLDPWAAPPGIASRDGSWPMPAFGSPRPTLPRGHFRMIDGNHRADAGKITGVPVLVSLSFFGVFFGSFAASIGEPLFGAMLASSCSAIALVRAAAWLAGFEAGGE